MIRVFTSASTFDGRVLGATVRPPQRQDEQRWFFPPDTLHEMRLLKQYGMLSGAHQASDGTLPGMRETSRRDGERILAAAAQVREAEAALARARTLLAEAVADAHAAGTTLHFAEFDGRGWSFAHDKKVSRVHWFENFKPICGAKGKPNRPNPMGSGFHGDKTFGCAKCQEMRAGKGCW